MSTSLTSLNDASSVDDDSALQNGNFVDRLAETEKGLLSVPVLEIEGDNRATHEDSATDLQNLDTNLINVVSSADRLLTEEMSNLSLEQVEMALFDVHGCSSAFALDSAFESPEEQGMESKLQELKQELERLNSVLPPNEKEAYQLALRQNSSYVKDSDFCSWFLKSDGFDVCVAARRIFSHFQLKEELFGKEVLSRDIRLSDLSKEDLEWFLSGRFQCGRRDFHGRPIVVMNSIFSLGLRGMPSLFRAVFFYLCSVYWRTEKRHKGIVLIYITSSAPDPFFQEMQLAQRLRVGLPRHVQAMHICGVSRLVKPFIQACLLFLRQHDRIRTRIHCGEEDSILAELESYGVLRIERGKDLFPANVEAEQRILERCRKWIAYHQRKESKSPKELSSTIHECDVLFGRGKRVRNHPGNIRLSHVAGTLREEYENARKFEKTAIADRIASIVQSTGGRFLKQDQGTWVEVDRETARNKISHFFRNTRTHKSTSS